MKYVNIDYMYRDGANWKTGNTVSFRVPDGEDPEPLVEILKSELGEGDNFIASQIGIDEVFSWTGHPDEDHCWHEIIGYSVTDSPSGYLDDRTMAMFIADVKNIDGWEAFEVGKCSGYGYSPDQIKDSLVKEGIVSPRIVSMRSKRDFGTRTIWLAIAMSDIEFIDFEEDDSVTVNVKNFDEDTRKEFSKLIYQDIEDLSESQKKIVMSDAKRVFDYAKMCNDLGVDFIFVS